jgi:ATP synthase protein I
VDAKNDKSESAFVRVVNEKVARKLRMQRDQTQGVWFGLGMSGLIGWSVTVPAIAGALFGAWLDRNHPSSRSWTLALLVAGLVLGCANAWRWVSQQDRAMRDDALDHHEEVSETRNG